MAREIRLKGTGSETWELWEVLGSDDDDLLLGRVVPHDSGVGFKLVDPTGKALSTLKYPTPELAIKWFPPAT